MSDIQTEILYRGEFASTERLEGGKTLERPVYFRPPAPQYLKPQQAREIARELIFAAEVAERAIETAESLRS